MQLKTNSIIKILIWFSLFLLYYSTSFGVEIYAKVDKTQGTMDDVFILTVTAKDTSQADKPQLPRMNDFQVQSRGQSSSYRTINGKFSSQIDFNYLLYPQRIGRLTVPPIRMDIDGKVYKTNPIKINIKKDTASVTSEKPIYVNSYLSTSEAFLGQQVIYTFELYVQQGTHVKNLQYSRPDLSEFHFEELGESSSAQRIIKGKAFEVTTLRLALFPNKIGYLKINQAILQGYQIIPSKRQNLWDDSFGFSMFNKTRPFNLRTKPLKIKVLPFPDDKKPKEFSGLVGQYVLQANLSQHNLKVGDSTTLTISITGNGQPGMIPKPELKMDSSLKIYEDQPVSKSEIHNNQIINNTIFTMAVVPSLPGDFSLPDIELTFFNIKNRKYETRRLKLPDLTVTGSVDKLTQVDMQKSSLIKKQKVKQLGQDILPIHRSVALLNNNGFINKQGWIYSVLFFSPMILFGFVWAVRWKYEHSKSHVDLIRQKQALSKFKKHLNQCDKNKSNEREYVNSMLSAFKEYIGDKSLQTGNALTPQEIEQWLVEKTVDDNLVNQYREIIEQCEMFQYAAGNLSSDVHEKIKNSLLQLAVKLEQK